MFSFDDLRRFGLGSQVNFLHDLEGPSPDMALSEAQLLSLISYVEAQHTTPYYTIGSAEAGAYMARDWLIEKSEDKPAARVHTIFRSDLDRAAHNHPWSNVSVILRGTYYELMPSPNGIEDLSAVPLEVLGRCTNLEPMVAVVRRAGDVVCRTVSSRHKLLVAPGEHPVSLFMSGPKKEDWGFFTENGFVVHTDYLVDV